MTYAIAPGIMLPVRSLYKVIHFIGFKSSIRTMPMWDCITFVFQILEYRIGNHAGAINSGGQEDPRFPKETVARNNIDDVPTGRQRLARG
jgi:hypothetical protein